MPNNITNVDKIYGLSKFWQEVNYNFVFLDKIDKQQWEENYKKAIIEVQQTKDDYEYYRVLQKFCALLKDGHTNVYFPEEIQKNVFTTYFGEYRIVLTNFGGKAIVTRVNLSKKEEIPIGSEIIKVNGLATQDYIDTFVKPYIASSTDYIVEDRSVSTLLKSPIGTTFNITLQLPNGTTKELTLTHSETKEKEIYPPIQKRALITSKWLKNNILYLALNSFQDDKINNLFEEKLPEVYKAKGLIIDIRQNGGGSTKIGLDILKYLTKDSILYGSKSFTRSHIPTFKAWGKWTKAEDTTGNSIAKRNFLAYKDQYYYEFPYQPDTIKLKKKRIAIPTAILTSHKTASAAEDFLIYADQQKHITKIGETTFGSTGQPFIFNLPGGGKARVCTKKDTYPDGREFIGYGIKPDIEVKTSLEQYINNEDPVVEKALEVLIKGK